MCSIYFSFFRFHWTQVADVLEKEDIQVISTIPVVHFIKFLVKNKFCLHTNYVLVTHTD